MGGKGGFGKTLASQGRAYRLQRSKSAAGKSVGMQHARDLEGRRLGRAGAAAALSQMDADRRHRRVRSIEEQKTLQQKEPSKDDSSSAVTDSDASTEQEDPEVREARMILDREFRAELEEDLALVAEAVTEGIALLRNSQPSV